MVLFFVGIIEMFIAAYWTKAVTNANAPMTGMITTVNIFIWFYVIQAVIEHIGDWTAIIPYAGGCAVGAMIGAVADDWIAKRRKAYRAKRSARKIAAQETPMPTGTYETIR